MFELEIADIPAEQLDERRKEGRLAVAYFLMPERPFAAPEDDAGATSLEAQRETVARLACERSLTVLARFMDYAAQPSFGFRPGLVRLIEFAKREGITRLFVHRESLLATAPDELREIRTRLFKARVHILTEDDLIPEDEDEEYGEDDD